MEKLHQGVFEGVSLVLAARETPTLHGGWGRVGGRLRGQQWVSVFEKVRSQLLRWCGGDSAASVEGLAPEQSLERQGEGPAGGTPVPCGHKSGVWAQVKGGTDGMSCGCVLAPEVPEPEVGCPCPANPVLTSLPSTAHPGPPRRAPSRSSAEGHGYLAREGTA